MNLTQCQGLAFTIIQCRKLQDSFIPKTQQSGFLFFFLNRSSECVRSDLPPVLMRQWAAPAPLGVRSAAPCRERVSTHATQSLVRCQFTSRRRPPKGRRSETPGPGLYYPSRRVWDVSLLIKTEPFSPKGHCVLRFMFVVQNEDRYRIRIVAWLFFLLASWRTLVYFGRKIQKTLIWWCGRVIITTIVSLTKYALRLSVCICFQCR